MTTIGALRPAAGHAAWTRLRPSRHLPLAPERRRRGERRTQLLGSSFSLGKPRTTDIQRGGNMTQVQLLTITTAWLLFVGLALPAGQAFGQTAQDLVGTWTWVSVENTRPDGTKVQLY